MDSKEIGSVVENSNDTLLEILFRLPPKSLFVFMSVSKRWKSLIKDPHFFKVYDERKRGSSCCIGKLLGFAKCDIKHNLLAHPNDWNQGCVSVRSEEFGVDGFCPPQRSCFIASSNNGLVLWGCIPSEHSSSEYYIGNPITKTWITLPPPPPPLYRDRSLSVGLTSECEYAEGSGGKVSFRVIVATGDITNKIIGVNSMPIETYSSREGKWRRSELVFPKSISIIDYMPPTVIGGTFYWFAYQGYLAVFDSSALDKEDNGDTPVKKTHLLQLIESPNDIGPKVIWRSDDGQTLWWGVSSFHFGTLEIYRRKANDDEDMWKLISCVPLDMLRQVIFKKLTKQDLVNELTARSKAGRYRDDSFLATVRSSVTISGFIPWDPTLVILRMWEKAYVYDWVNQTMNELPINNDEDYYTDLGAEWYPYFHPLSLASYTFK